MFRNPSRACRITGLSGGLLTAALPMQRTRRTALLSRPDIQDGSGEPSYNAMHCFRRSQ
jgi:hypothetical protein